MFGIRRADISGWIVPALVAAVQGIRLVVLASLPDRKLVGHIPDDAFYYLVSSRNFARLGRWTFDGVEPTSGFHLLWGYLLAALYRIDPAIGLHGIFVITGVIQTACMATAAWLVQRTATRIFGAGTQAGIAIIFLSAISLQMSMAMMETAVAILASAAVLNLLCRDNSSPSASPLWSAVVLGLAGTLARSDFGLLPLCLFAMQLVRFRKSLASSRLAKLAACVLAGATLGLGVIALHTHWISGGWVQASARQKLFWAQVHGFSIIPTVGLLEHFMGIGVFTGNLSSRVDRLLTCAGWLLLVLFIVGLVLAFKRSATAQRVLAAAIVCTILAFVFVYRFNSASIQGWYISSFEAPLAVLAGGAACSFARRWRWATGAAAIAVCACGIWLSRFTPMPGQIELYKRALDLRARPELRPVGAWNAGILSYFSGGEVVNLDGLVNDRILPHSENGTLLQYVQQRGLHTITDFPELFSLPEDRKRGGYADGALERCLLESERPGERTKVWLVKPECIVSGDGNSIQP